MKDYQALGILGSIMTIGSLVAFLQASLLEVWLFATLLLLTGLGQLYVAYSAWKDGHTKHKKNLW